jgi:demethylmenaquinone methyltransferase / 2-methoxy-6-polyprenyl-1,4-benzoquinol methylase
VSNGDVFADIAAKYDRINTILSLGRDGAWRRTAISRLPTGRVLDLGGGTGAANRDLGDRHVVAIDPAPEMLARNEGADRVVGVGEALPFADGSFDAVFSAYVFRNLDSVDRTLEEIARVLRTGGKAGIVDLGRPRRPLMARLHRGASAIVLPLVGRLAGAPEEYRYLHHSLDELPPPEVMFVGGPLVLEDTWRMGPFGFVYGAILAKP